MLSPQAAWSRLTPHLEPLAPRLRRRCEAAGHRLAARLTATVDVPPADVSAMDGYAVAGEVAADEARPVAGEVAAGDPPGLSLPDGVAVRIMTGAPVPDGFDRVIPVEEATEADGSVRFIRPAPAGRHIRRVGEVLQRGDPLLAPGALLTPAALALLATHGYEEVSVVPRPSIRLLVTGDEVVPPEVEPSPGQLRDSHTDFLLAACATLGVDLEALGIAPDRPDPLRKAIRRALDTDVLLLSGGVSMGAYDLVAGALEGLGCEILFHGVAVQPGKPLLAARADRALIFGLPGNPAAVMVSFWLFVRPALRRLAGHPDRFWGGALRARCLAPLPGARDRDRFLPAEVGFEGGEILAAPVAPHGSHDVAAYAQGTALLRVPAHSEPAPPGTACEILPLADWQATAHPTRAAPAQGGRP